MVKRLNQLQHCHNLTQVLLNTLSNNYIKLLELKQYYLRQDYRRSQTMGHTSYSVVYILYMEQIYRADVIYSCIIHVWEFWISNCAILFLNLHLGLQFLVWMYVGECVSCYWRKELTHPNNGIQFSHGDLFGSLHRLDHLLLVLHIHIWEEGEKRERGRGKGRGRNEISEFKLNLNSEKLSNTDIKTYRNTCNVLTHIYTHINPSAVYIKPILISHTNTNMHTHSQYWSKWQSHDLQVFMDHIHQCRLTGTHF